MRRNTLGKLLHCAHRHKPVVYEIAEENVPDSMSIEGVSGPICPMDVVREILQEIVKVTPKSDRDGGLTMSLLSWDSIGPIKLNNGTSEKRVRQSRFKAGPLHFLQTLAADGISRLTR